MKDYFNGDFPKTIGIFRALQLGDLLCTVPAFRAVRCAFPEARITLIGLPWSKVLLRRFHHYLDEIVEFPGYPGLPEQTPQVPLLPQFLTEMQKKRFDLVVQMHGSGAIVNPVVTLFNARVNAGFYRRGEYRPDPGYFLPYPDHLHEILRYVELIKFLGIQPMGDDLEFPIFEGDEQELFIHCGMDDLKKGEYVCIHPGSRLMTRRWIPERFAAVADAMASLGLKVIITGLPNEVELAKYIKSTMKSKSITLAGRTTLGALAVLIKGARLLISNDTGVSHIAAALKTPSVIVVTGSDPDRWSPLDKNIHRPVYYPVECRPCKDAVCPIGQPCAANVTPEAVISQCRRLLDR